MIRLHPAKSFKIVRKFWPPCQCEGILRLGYGVSLPLDGGGDGSFQLSGTNVMPVGFPCGQGTTTFFLQAGHSISRPAELSSHPSFCPQCTHLNLKSLITVFSFSAPLVHAEFPQRTEIRPAFSPRRSRVSI
jgi:hypothetical protein